MKLKNALIFTTGLAAGICISNYLTDGEVFDAIEESASVIYNGLKNRSSNITTPVTDVM